MKTYTQLQKFLTLKDRYNYLRLGGKVGEATFGSQRRINQILYQSKKWREVRNFVILRDNGCELGLEDYKISGQIMVHHIMPLTIVDILNHDQKCFDPNNLICCSLELHNALHYNQSYDSIINLYFEEYHERTKNDTKLW